MKEKNSIKDIDKEKGEFQHKMFKLSLLLKLKNTKKILFSL